MSAGADREQPATTANLDTAPFGERAMSPDTLAIIGTILGAAGVLATLITTTTGRLGARLTAVEKETSRLSGLLEGLA